MEIYPLLCEYNIVFTRTDIPYRSHYEDMVKLNPEFAPMLEGCLANRNKWVEIEEGKEDKNDSK